MQKKVTKKQPVKKAAAKKLVVKRAAPKKKVTVSDVVGVKPVDARELFNAFASLMDTYLGNGKKKVGGKYQTLIAVYGYDEMTEEFSQKLSIYGSEAFTMHVIESITMQHLRSKKHKTPLDEMMLSLAEAHDKSHKPSKK